MIRPYDSDLKIYEFGPILISGRRFHRKSSAAETILMILQRLFFLIQKALKLMVYDGVVKFVSGT